MAVKKIIIDEEDITRDVERGGKFLRTLGIRPRIRAVLSPRGYSDAEHQRLWDLLLVLMGYKPSVELVPSAAENVASLTFIDSSDEPLLDALRIVLANRYPDQYDYITNGLTAQKGAGSVGVVQHIVDRYVAVREGTDPNRASTREEDKTVAELLAIRAVLSPAIEDNLRNHLAKAKAIAPDLPSTLPTEEQTKYEAAALEFHLSINEWRELARRTIKRRDYLISLGLAERRKAKSSGAPTEPAEDDDGPMD